MENNTFKPEELSLRESKIRKIYNNNKTSILSTFILILIFIFSTTIYLEFKKKKRIDIADNYIKAKVLIRNNEKNQATKLLKSIVYENDKVYSTLSLFILLDENLLINNQEISKLFENLLQNNKFEYEIENLIIFKKALLQSDYLDENELLEVTKPLINGDSLWKNHALLLLGDYFFNKNQQSKAKEFYKEIISSDDKSNGFLQLARSRLSSIDE